MHLTHTLPIFIDEDSKYLLLGSFPSVKSREFNFYYSHPRNRFFPTLYKLFNESHSSLKEERKEFLRRHHIALYDVVEECDIEASYDSSIRNVVPFNISEILEKYPSIKAIGITGKTAHKLFDKFLLSQVEKRQIKVVYLPSTSPANAKTTEEELVKNFKVIFE